MCMGLTHNNNSQSAIFIYYKYTDCWIQLTVRGEPPPPCLDSSLTRVDHYQAVFFGGFTKTDEWIEPDVYILDLQQWVSILCERLLI